MQANLTSKFRVFEDKFNDIKKNLLKKVDYKTVYIDKNTTNITLNEKEKVDIVLSPSFYWVRDEKLPIKYEFQAKNLVPGLFEGVLSEGNYSYISYRKADKSSWLLYAYDDTLIAKKLDALKIQDRQIHAIYFAQSELDNINQPIKTDDTLALIKHEDTLISMPLTLVENATSIDDALRVNSRTSHSIAINRYSNLPISEKSINIIAVTLILFIGLFLTEFMLSKKSLQELYAQSFEIKRQYKLPATSFELNSMKKNLQRTASEQEKLREVITYIVKMPLSNGEHLLSMELKKGQFEVSINLNEPKHAEKIKNYWQKKLSIKSMKVKEKTLSAKIDI